MWKFFLTVFSESNPLVLKAITTSNQIQARPNNIVFEPFKKDKMFSLRAESASMVLLK